MMQGITLADVLEATNATPVDVDDLSVTLNRVHLDSRTIQPGDLFWCVAGENHDSHQFINSARNNGAIASLISHDQLNDTSGSRLVVPPQTSTVTSFGNFARWYRQQQEAFVIGITGSVGKTTTRQMIHTVLEQSFHGVSSPGNFNNHFGVPLSLLQIQPEHEFAVLELGASHSGEIRELAQMMQPDVGIITRIAPAHLESFGTLETIIQTKGELLEALPADGFAILNGDDELVRQTATRAICRVLFAGEQDRNQVQATEIRQTNTELNFCVHGVNYRLPVGGRHHLTAALAAITLGEEIGMSPTEIAAGLERFRPVAGRSQIRTIGSWTVIDDTYNASPASVGAACELLGNWQTKQNKILILGDMLELGTESANYHREMGRLAGGTNIDYLISLGTFSGEITRGAREAGMSSHQLAQCSNWDALETVLPLWLSPGDVLLVKGSRSMHMERVVSFLEELVQQQTITNDTFRAPSRICA